MLLNQALPKKPKNFILNKINKLIHVVRSNALCCTLFIGGGNSIALFQHELNKYNWSQLGLEFTNYPEQADLLIVIGIITNKLAPKLRKTYEQMNFPKWVISLGSTANGGGAFYNTYSTVTGADHIIPIDLYIPETNPLIDGLSYGIAQLKNKIKNSYMDN